MKRISRVGFAGAGVLGLLSLQGSWSSSGSAAPDLLLATVIALALLRREAGGAASLGFGALRASLSIDPVLPTLGYFLLAGEAASISGATFFGERAVLPFLLGFVAGVGAPLVRALSPAGATLPGTADLLLSAAGTAAACTAVAAGGLLLKRLLR